MVKRLVLLALVLLALGSRSYGQDAPPPAPTAYDIGVYQFGNTTTPFRYSRVHLQQITCDLAPVEGVTGVTNPKAYAWDDPDRPGRMCRVAIDSILSTLPDGTYSPLIRAAAAVGSEPEVVSPWVVGAGTFVRVVEPPPPPPDPCPAGAVSVLVGDWTRSVSLGAFGRVTYNLQLSTTIVTTIVVKFNGVERDRLTGSDLRNVAGSYFRVPTIRGSYPLVIEAHTAAGCIAVASRPMTVNVK